MSKKETTKVKNENVEWWESVCDLENPFDSPLPFMNPKDDGKTVEYHPEKNLQVQTNETEKPNPGPKAEESITITVDLEDVTDKLFFKMELASGEVGDLKFNVYHTVPGGGIITKIGSKHYLLELKEIILAIDDVLRNKKKEKGT